MDENLHLEISTDHASEGSVNERNAGIKPWSFCFWVVILAAVILCFIFSGEIQGLNPDDPSEWIAQSDDYHLVLQVDSALLTNAWETAETVGASYEFPGKDVFILDILAQGNVTAFDQVKEENIEICCPAEIRPGERTEQVSVSKISNSAEETTGYRFIGWCDSLAILEISAG